ncbi:MAG TPA: hypothetical protein PLP33_24635 [Leptospiraceae bacterium]|nr:hypothetical protein [Leptospiraceae bacterium]
MTVNQAEKWFGIPVLGTLLEKMQEKEHGDIETCPSCGALNAYSHSLCNIDSNSGKKIMPEDGIADGGENYTEEEDCIFSAP